MVDEKHHLVVMPCTGFDRDSGLCGTLIGIALDVGPAVFRCPHCNCLYIVDPLVEDTGSEIQGHHVEIYGSQEDIAARFGTAGRLIVAKVGSLERVYRAPVYSARGAGFEFSDGISDRDRER